MPGIGVGAQRACINAAQVLAQQLNGMTADIQALRGDAELGLADAVNAGERRDAADRRRSTGSWRPSSAGDATTANLLDQRDVYIDQLAQLMDINVVRNDHNQVIGLHQFRHPAGRHQRRRRWRSTRRAR